MEKVLLGDNQFFAVNHLSDERSRAQAIRFKDDQSIIRVIDQAIELGINTFMCTTHDRIANICQHIREHPDKYRGFNIFPCMPYAHKYANAVTELGIIGTVKQYVPGNIFSTFTKGGLAYVSKDFIKLMEIFIDAEMKMFKGINTPVIFIQNVVVDLILGLKMFDVFKHYDNYIRKKYNAEPGYITMNLPAANTCIATGRNFFSFRYFSLISLPPDILNPILLIEAQIIGFSTPTEFRASSNAGKFIVI